MHEYAITQWPDTAAINERLQALVRMPMRPIARNHMGTYERVLEEKCAKSRQMTDAAKRIIPGAGQHNIAFNYPFPVAIERAAGPYLWDVDGNRYCDFAAAGGPVLLGHNHPEVNKRVAALLETCSPATGFFHEYEFKLAQLISEHMPAIEMFRMLGSGTEAVMGAIRCARAFTGKTKVIKVGGDFHGWSDQMVYSTKLPKSATWEAVGIPNEVFTHIQETFPNDIICLEQLMAENEKLGGTAAVILEPLGPESGTRPVLKEYNRQVRELCDHHQALLIFDEVVTGFRVGLGGAQGYTAAHN
jgi:glutamate-1-semialdehyde 2,1-aminomutase